MKASSLITSKEFDVNNLPRKSTQWKWLNWQIVNLCCFCLSEKWVGVVHRKMSGCLPFTVLFIQVIFVAFFNHQLSHQMLNEGGTLYPTPHRNECHMPWVTFWDTIGQVWQSKQPNQHVAGFHDKDTSRIFPSCFETSGTFWPAQIVVS